MAVWLLWRPGTRRERHLGVIVAASTSVFAWAPFFLAVTIPGSNVEDTPGQVERIASLPANMVTAATITIVALAGYALYRYEDRASRDPSTS